MTSIGVKMSKRNKITPVEWEIMESVWSLGNRTTARDVYDHAFPHGEKAYTTVQTILNNLHSKGMLKREKIGMVNFYTPKKSRKNMVKSEFAFFLSRVFDGSIQALADFLMDSDNLDMKDLEAIKMLVDKKEKELKLNS
jgi:BlaI family penicillinase repressor